MKTKGLMYVSIQKHFRNVSLVSFLCFFLFSFMAQAGIETFSKQFIGSQIKFPDSLYVYDNLFTYPLNPDWEKSRHIRSQKVTNLITLKIDANSTLYTASSYTCSVKLEVKYKDAKGKLFSINQVLSVEFTNGVASTEVDQNVYKFSGAHEVNAKIVEVNSNYPNGIPGHVTPGNLILENLISIERFYEFNPFESRKSMTIISLDATNELEISWPSSDGAEEYQLEWLFVNNYDGETINGDRSSVGINYDFGHNATRITVSGVTNSYRIAKVFEKGYVMFRYRAVGRTGSDNKIPVYGNWNNPTKGTLGDYSIKEYYKIFNSHEGDSKNWFYSASYAEEGKKKETVSYMDGTSRGRQMVSKLNTENQTIVGETIYDHEGRPAVNILPVPTGSTSIGYYPLFNLNDQAIKKPFSSLDFEKSNPDNTCDLQAGVLSNISGAAKYYSPLNPNRLGHQAYVPDALGYPFTQVEYTPDNTGRINRQGGLGKDFQLGSNQESKYYYGKPLQEQLDKMFGSEVGHFSHYQKNMVSDANGQLSVSYLDQQGRIIATALAGNAPKSLDPIVPLTIISPTANILDNQAIVPGDKSLRSQFVYLANTVGPHTFNYQVTANDFFTSGCDKENFCLDCVYDLEISIKDECGVELVKEGEGIIDGTVPITKRIGNYDDIVCQSNGETVVPEFTVTIPKTGTYYINKTLTVNKDALNFYQDRYLYHSKCVKTLDEFTEDQIKITDFTPCIPATDCAAQCSERIGSLADFLANNPGATVDDYNLQIERCKLGCKSPSVCVGMKKIMIGDMSPGGQYAETKYIEDPANPDLEILVAKDHTSIFYYVDEDDMNTFNVNLGSEGIEFKDENGDKDQVVLPDGKKGTPNELFKISLKDFIQQWKPSWANAIVKYHPEYKYYKWCEKDQTEASGAYDMLMLTTETFDDAMYKGLFNPLGMESVQVPVPNDVDNERLPIVYLDNKHLDPFFLGDDREQVRGWMFLHMIGAFDSDPTTLISYWQYAAISAVCNAGTDLEKEACAAACSTYFSSPTPCNSDRVWKMFRALYLGQKNKYVEQLIKNYVGDVAYEDIGVRGDFIEKEKRFPNPTKLLTDNFGNDILSTDPATIEATKAAGADSIKNNCNRQCESYADNWMLRLSGCKEGNPNWETDSVKVRNGLIQVCIQGCDSAHGAGSSTVPIGDPGVGPNHYKSFAEVIIGELGPDRLECSANLITFPVPYDNDISSIRIGGNLDTCACDKVLYIDKMYADLVADGELPVGATKSSLFLEEYKVSLDELNAKVCLCKSAFAEGGSTTWSMEANWSSASVIALTNNRELVPSEITCEKCVNCYTVTTLMDQFKATVELAEGGPISADKQGLYDINLTTHLNNTLNLDLTITDYYNFYKNCDKVQHGGLSCNPTKQAIEYLRLIKIFVERNELLTSACLFSSPYTPSSPTEKAKRNFSYTDVLVKNVDPSFVVASKPCDHKYKFKSISGNKLFGNIVKYNAECVETVLCELEFEFINPGFKFESIHNFKNLRVDPVSAGNNFNFFVDAIVAVKGEFVTTTLKGKTSCIPVGTCSNNSDDLTLCTRKLTPTLEDDDCRDKILEQTFNNARILYHQYITKAKGEFETSYLAKCLKAASSEIFTMQYKDGEYHYTLYYYDQAGNLVRTIPPDGVELLSNADVTKAATDRKNNTRTVFTKHRMATTYDYNSLNQLVSQIMPDHDNFEMTLSNATSGLPEHLNVIKTEFTGDNGGYLIATDPANPNQSIFYYTADKGKTWQLVSGIGLADLNAVHFVGTTGYAVGDKGVILKTTDGNSWNIISSGLNDDFAEVHFTSASNGIVVSKTGKLFSTTNGGLIWNPVPVSDSHFGLNQVNEISFLNSNMEGIAVGSEGIAGAIYRTHDGGQHWTPETSVRTTDLKTVHFIGTSDIGYAAGIDGTLLKTKDKGATWYEVDSKQDYVFKKIFFASELVGSALSEDGILYQTTAGGNGWTPAKNPAGTDKYVDIHFTDKKGYAVSKNGEILTTATGGGSWIPVKTLSIGVNFTSIFFENPNVGYVAGENGKLYKTTDAGKTWPEVATNVTSKNFASIHYKGDFGFALFSDGTVRETHNGGNNWNPLDPLNTTYTAFSFSNADNGHLLAANGEMAFTNTAGQSWSASTDLPSGGIGANLYFNPAGVGCVVGNNGTIFSSNNYGNTWENSTTNVGPLVLKGIHMVNANVAYVAGEGGSLFITDDGGSSWKALPTGYSKALNDVAIIGTKVFAVGYKGAIRYKDDINNLNEVWKDKKIGNPDFAHKRIAFNGASGYIISLNGDILISNDYGASWAFLYDGSWDRPFKGMFLTSEFSGYAVGKMGAIVRLTSTTAEFLNSSIFSPKILDSHSYQSVIYAVGVNGTIMKSSTGGQQYSPLNSGVTDRDLRGIDFTSTSPIFVVGDGLVLKSIDNGASWIRKNIPGKNLDAVFVLDDNKAYAVGNGGVIIRTEDAFETWEDVVSPVVLDLTAVSLNGSTGFITGKNGTILKGKNIFGSTPDWDELKAPNPASDDWVKYTSPFNPKVTANLNDVYFRDATTGYVVGDKGTFLKTINGGTSWELKSLNTTENIANIDFNTNNIGSIGGANTTVISINDANDNLSTRFFYDALGRLVASQNTKQFKMAVPRFSYIKFDAQNRVVETGEFAKDVSTLTAEMLNHITFPDNLNMARYNKVITQYDEYYSKEANGFFGAAGQQNLRNRISTVALFEQTAGDRDYYNHATHYSYDVHGNVKSVIQDTPSLENK